MSKPEFVYVIYIQSTAEKIWQALTDPEMTKEFWGRHQNRSDWKPGSEWRHVNYDDATDIAVAGTVVESDPPRRLVPRAPRNPLGGRRPDRSGQPVFALYGTSCDGPSAGVGDTDGTGRPPRTDPTPVD